MPSVGLGATNAGLPSGDVESVKVAVLAAGSFGMAMAVLAARRHHQVVIYARDAATVSSGDDSCSFFLLVVTRMCLRM